MRSETVAAVKVVATFDVFHDFVDVHLGEVIEGMANGDGGVDKP